MNTKRILQKEEILQAQEQTKSAKQAARFLNVSFHVYKKYATMHGIYEQHKNSLGGKGIEKRKNIYPNVPLEEILQGKHPNYSLRILKDRLIKNGMMLEECDECGFKEKRELDYKAPLTISFIDGNNSNFELTNLRILCYNCLFLSSAKTKRISETDKEILGIIEEEAIPNIRTFDEDININESDILEMQKGLLKELSGDK